MYCESPQLEKTLAVAITTAARETSPYSSGSRKRVSARVPARPRTRAPTLVETVQKTPRTALCARLRVAGRGGGSSERSRGPERSCTPRCSSVLRARGPRRDPRRARFYGASGTLGRALTRRSGEAPRRTATDVLCRGESG